MVMYVLKRTPVLCSYAYICIFYQFADKVVISLATRKNLYNPFLDIVGIFDEMGCILRYGIDYLTNIENI